MSVHPFAQLMPDVVIDAVEVLGHPSDGRILALNSYENRVYQVGLDDRPPRIVKFYRPGRWSRAAIREEHAFALELASADIPVIAPIRYGGETLLEHGGFLYAVYPRHGGRWPELATADERTWMGRFLGRIHAVGSRSDFEYRPSLSWEVIGQDSADFLLGSGWIPPHLEIAYQSVTDDLLSVIGERFVAAGSIRWRRLHGDCHCGNVLWTDDGPHFVDLDDCLMGPAIQDLWMLLSGSGEEMAQQLGELLAGYTQFEDFDFSERRLIEPLRTLRIIHYAAWLARRWDDPAFPLAFPWFGETRYWEQHILDLREQLSTIHEAPFELY